MTYDPEIVSKQLRLIADALENLFLVEMCDERHSETGSRCALDPTHAGRHVTRDGRHWWLED